jgi:hypothetical protein
MVSLPYKAIDPRTFTTRNRSWEPEGMPRYFFNLAPGHPFDEEGEDLPDDAAATEIARQTVQEILRDGPPIIPEERLVVSNERGELVAEVYLEEFTRQRKGST